MNKRPRRAVERLRSEVGGQELQVETNQERRFEILENEAAREVIKQRMLHFTEAVHDKGIDTLVFLDKSARPFSWMFRKLWKGLYPERQLPEVKFVNIGTGDGIHHGNRFKEDPVDAHGGIPDAALQRMFDDEWLGGDELSGELKEIALQETDLIEQMRATFSKRFDGKDVLVVDEYVLGGTTLLQAHLLFDASFPEAKSVQSTGLFIQDVVNKEQEKHPVIARAEELHDDQEVFITDLVPWTQKDGFTGVFEPSDMGMLSRAAAPEHLKAFTEVLNNELAEYKKEMFREIVESSHELASLLGDVESLLSRLRKAMIPLRSAATSVERLEKEMQEQLTAIDSWMMALPTESDDVSMEQMNELWQSLAWLENDLLALPVRIQQLAKQEFLPLEDAKKIQRQARVVTGGLMRWEQDLFEDFAEAIKKRDFIEKVDTGFNTQARQLRREMNTLAQEVVDQTV